MVARLTEAVARALSALHCAGARSALCGALAVAAHGVSRATADIDLVVLHEDLAAIEPSLAADGWLALAPVDWSGGAAQRRHILIAGDTCHILDLLTTPSAHAWLDRREERRCADSHISVLTLRDLFAMKRASGRLEDLADIDRLQDATNVTPVADLASVFAEIDELNQLCAALRAGYLMHHPDAPASGFELDSVDGAIAVWQRHGRDMRRTLLPLPRAVLDRLDATLASPTS